MGRASTFARVIGLTKSLSPHAIAPNEADPCSDVVAHALADDAARATTDSVPPPSATIIPMPAPAPKAEAPAPLPMDLIDAIAAVASPPNTVAAPETVAAAAVTIVAPEVTIISPAAPIFAPTLPPAASLLPSLAAHPQPSHAPETVRASITADAIDAIEADIAQLLATLERDDDKAEAPIDDWSNELSASDAHFGVDDGEPMGVLLSELDRMWQADPQITAPAFH